MSENKVFRKISLERLSSPEELDQRLTVTSPIGWVALIAVGILIFTGLIWGIFGSIADKAVGRGIIISSGGITGIVHHTSGQITDVSIKDGDYVRKGDVIARIEQTDLIVDINKYKEDLAVIKGLDLDNPKLDSSMLNFNVYVKLIDIAKDLEMAKASLEVHRASFMSQQEQANYELEKARLQYEESLENFNNYKYLYEHQAVAPVDFNDAERRFKISELNYITKKENLLRIPESQIRQAEINHEVLNKQFRDTLILSQRELEDRISKMQLDLMNNSDIVSTVSGRVLELQVQKGDIVQAGVNICTIAQEKKTTDSLEAIIYVPVEKGKRIMTGMEVNISPSTVRKEESGFMLGHVVSVSEYPSSAQGMMLTLGNKELVQRLAGADLPIEVRVELIMDHSTISGYKWSTPKGPPIMIDSGTFCIGEVKVEQQRPISMVIPFIKRILPMYS